MQVKVLETIEGEEESLEVPPPYWTNGPRTPAYLMVMASPGWARMFQLQFNCAGY